MGISFSVMPGILSGMPTTVHFTHLNAHWPCFYVGLPPTMARGNFQNAGHFGKVHSGKCGLNAGGLLLLCMVHAWNV